MTSDHVIVSVKLWSWEWWGLMLVHQHYWFDINWKLFQMAINHPVCNSRHGLLIPKLLFLQQASCYSPTEGYMFDFSLVKASTCREDLTRRRKGKISFELQFPLIQLNWIAIEGKLLRLRDDINMPWPQYSLVLAKSPHSRRLSSFPSFFSVMYLVRLRGRYLNTLVPSVFVPLDQRSGNSQASMRSKGRRLEVRDWYLKGNGESLGAWAQHVRVPLYSWNPKLMLLLCLFMLRTERLRSQQRRSLRWQRNLHPRLFQGQLYMQMWQRLRRKTMR